MPPNGGIQRGRAIWLWPQLDNMQAPINVHCNVEVSTPVLISFSFDFFPIAYFFCVTKRKEGVQLNPGLSYLGYVAPDQTSTTSNTNSGLSYLGYVPPEHVQVSDREPSTGFGKAFKQFMQKLSGDNTLVVDDATNQPSVEQQPSGQGVNNSTFSPAVIDYFNADLAKHYGMSKETAYQEAMANTSYQRAVQDMQAAGLNPAALFGSGRGSGAQNVSYVKGNSGSAYGNFTQSEEKDKLFSNGSWFGVSTIAGLLTMAATKNPNGFWIGQQGAQGIMGLLDKLSKSSK